MRCRRRREGGKRETEKSGGCRSANNCHASLSRFSGDRRRKKAERKRVSARLEDQRQARRILPELRKILKTRFQKTATVPRPPTTRNYRLREILESSHSGHRFFASTLISFDETTGGLLSGQRDRYSSLITSVPTWTRLFSPTPTVCTQVPSVQEFCCCRCRRSRGAGKEKSIPVTAVVHKARRAEIVQRKDWLAGKWVGWQGRREGNALYDRI